ncbi:hypothetical protein EJB05_17604, partial [Eragrostis curvula]
WASCCGGGRLTWTNVMSGFVLRRFCELVGQGVKIDKGFKEVHLNAVARDLKEFTGLEDHPKDAEFLNVPLINYTQMQTIFASGVATGRFAMGSNEPLGQPREEDTIDLEAEGFKGGAAAGTSAAANGGVGTSAATNGGAGTSEVKPKTDDEKEPKKRKLSCQDEHLMQGITSAPSGALMFALGHLMDNKSVALTFLEMNDADRDLWLRTHLSKHFY